MDKHAKDIAKRLTEFVEKNFDTQEHAAEQMGMASQSLWGLMNGVRGIGSKNLNRLRKVGCNTEWLKTGEGSMLLSENTSIVRDSSEIQYGGKSKIELLQEIITDQQIIIKEQSNEIENLKRLIPSKKLKDRKGAQPHIESSP